MENTENKFKHDGLWYIAVEQSGCRNCDLSSAIGICTIGSNYSVVPACGCHERQDNRNVIFVRSDVDNLGDEE